MNVNVYALGERLVELTVDEAVEKGIPSVFVVTSADGRQLLETIKMSYENEPNNRTIGFSKVEAQQECLAGTLFIPELVDVMGTRFKISFYIDNLHVVLVDDDNFSQSIIDRIMRKKIHQGDNKEKFLYNYFAEFMSNDQAVLVQYEKDLMKLEEDVLQGKKIDFQARITPFRNEMLTLREYYDEIADLGRALEENENDFFDKKNIKYFGTLSDRADRLMGRTVHLLDRAKQISDTYQTNIDAKQNSNMQFLTIISTIFLPLTLITSWYGMNFRNMPELESGYPFVIGLSVVVIIVCIIIFKRKNIL